MSFLSGRKFLENDNKYCKSEIKLFVVLLLLKVPLFKNYSATKASSKMTISLDNLPFVRRKSVRFLQITETHPSFMTESVSIDASIGFGGGSLHFLFTLYRGDMQRAILMCSLWHVRLLIQALFPPILCHNTNIWYQSDEIRIYRKTFVRRRKNVDWCSRQWN